jgi:hypothetical protein
MAQIFAAHRMFLESMTPGQPRSGLPPRDLRTEIPEPPTKKQRRQNEARADSRGHKGDRREKDPPEGPLKKVTAGWGASPPYDCISSARLGLTTTTPLFVVALAGQPPPGNTEVSTGQPLPPSSEPANPFKKQGDISSPGSPLNSFLSTP